MQNILISSLAVSNSENLVERCVIIYLAESVRPGCRLITPQGSNTSQSGLADASYKLQTKSQACTFISYRIPNQKDKIYMAENATFIILCGGCVEQICVILSQQQMYFLF